MTAREHTPIPATDVRGEPTTLGEYNGFEIYPMPVFVTLSVDDPGALATWYESALGFGTMLVAPVIHLRRRKYQDVLIVPRVPDSARPGGGITVHFSADGEIDALAERAKAAPPLGSSAVRGPIETPWNTRDLHVTDPAGHRLVFTSRSANPHPESTEQWRAHFEAGKKQ